MKEYFKVDEEKLQKMMDIKIQLINDEITFDEAKAEIKKHYKSITPEEFAFVEQKIKNMGMDDKIIFEKMDGLFNVVKELLVKEEIDLPEGHPIRTYQLENAVVLDIMNVVDVKRKEKFIKNQWLEIYDKLEEYKTHLSRKQNQLFSTLERKGFDRPSKIMWSFDNAVKNKITEARKLLNEDKVEEFVAIQEDVLTLVRDIIEKETEILYPTSLKLIPEEEFRAMRSGDDEIGYALIEKPKGFYPIKKEPEVPEKAEFIDDFQMLLSKYGFSKENKVSEVMDVKQGKLTLDQINLIYQHLPVDLSYVDENEIVKFYSDTKHRVFPRSAGVIGRDVKNCHPRESVETVEKIISAFREGKQSEAEFWLEIGGKFIYITYVAVRDEAGKFRGVLEMMQDVTKIRSLTGSQRLLSWETEDYKTEEKTEEKDDKKSEKKDDKTENKYGLNKSTTVFKLIESYPYMKAFLVSLNPEFEKLNNPVLFEIMAPNATLDMVAMKGGFEYEEFIAKLSGKIEETETLTNGSSTPKSSETEDIKPENKYGLNKSTTVFKLVESYPYMKAFLVSLAPEFEKLNNPVLFEIMAPNATLDMVAMKGGFEYEEFIAKLSAKIADTEAK